MLDSIDAQPTDLVHEERTLPFEFLNEIEKLGHHPFILVRIGSAASGSYVNCKTQNDAGAFVNELIATPNFSQSLLVRAIELALQQEIYDAAGLLFSWTRAADVSGETVYFAQPDGKFIFPLYNYPVFALDTAVPAKSPQERLQDLRDMLDIYLNTDGNDALRHSIIEAIAFALSRAFGAQKKYSDALAAVDSGLTVKPYSIHLKAAKYALQLRLDGKQVPPRLEKYIGEDNGYLKQFTCQLPFERFDIGPNGDVLVCCGHWLPTSIGNFMKDSVNDVLNSPQAQKIRQSVTDGSFKYCNHLECGAMAQETLPRIDGPLGPRAQKAIAEKNFQQDGVNEILFAFDQTCNLSCPSCRTHVITEKASQSIEKAKAVEEKLLPMLSSLKILHINPAGELFGSKPSRKLLELINDERCPDLKIRIISNGTLFSQEEWNKFPGIHNKVETVRVSIDAATKETFETLRRLGKYDVFLKNMRFLRDLRINNVIPQLVFSFTYQLGNFREMRAFIDFCDEMHADFAIFERLQNIAFRHNEFVQKAVHSREHQLYPEFIEIIKDPAFRASRVWHDFDYDGVAKLTAEEARNRTAPLNLG